MTNNIAQLISQAKKNAHFQPVLDQAPYAQLIGIVMHEIQGDLIFSLPFKPENIGNSSVPALHGGVIGGFLESAALLHLMWAHESTGMPLTVSFSIDYLHSAKAEILYAKCHITKQGRRIANVEITSWQSDPSKPIAVARAHFLLKHS